MNLSLARNAALKRRSSTFVRAVVAAYSRRSLTAYLADLLRVVKTTSECATVEERPFQRSVSM